MPLTDGNPAVMMFTTPPIASVPYSTEAGPRTTSTRSMPEIPAMAGQLAEILLTSRVVEAKSVLEQQDALPTEPADRRSRLVRTHARNVEAGEVAECVHSAC